MGRQEEAKSEEERIAAMVERERESVCEKLTVLNRKNENDRVRGPRRH